MNSASLSYIWLYNRPMLRKLLWLILHPFFENSYTKNIINSVVNFFKPDFVTVNGNKIFIDKDDRVISLELLLSGKWEEFEASLFEKNIHLGDTVIDIGAHIGYYTLIAAKKVGPTGKVYAFEPLLKNFKLLKKNVQVNGYINVIAVNKAVSNRNGTSKLFLSREDNFGDQRIYDPEGNRSSITIGTVRLDSYFKNKDQKINMIKMDIQGAEVKALTGAQAILRKNNHLKLFTEFWPKGLRQCGSSGQQYLDLLRKYNFKLFEINSGLKKVSVLSVQKVLKDYPEDSPFNTDLFCVK